MSSLNTENTRNELKKQKRDKLKKKCKSLKISGEGTKTDMINRIISKMHGNLHHNMNIIKSSDATSLSNNIININMTESIKKPTSKSILSKKSKRITKTKRNITNLSNKQYIVKNTGLKIKYKVNESLLINGYFRTYILWLVWSTKIIDITLLFLFPSIPSYKNLKFSSKYKSSKPGLKLSADKISVIKTDSNYSQWILPDIKPVNHGIICWRLFVENPNKELLTFGITTKTDQKDKKIEHNIIYGISRNNKLKKNYYKPLQHTKRSKIDLTHFFLQKNIIDILLNVNKGILKFKDIQNIQNKEVKIWDIPRLPKNGWIPYFYFSQNAKNTKLEIKKIDSIWYGKLIINPLMNIESYYDNLPKSAISNLLNIENLNDKDRNLLIIGYIKRFIEPNRYIIHLCVVFLFDVSRKIKFSDEYMSEKNLELIDDNYCVTKIAETYSWILADIEPVEHGIVCWRVFVENPDLEYIKFGISTKRMFRDLDYNEEGVYGIARFHSKNIDYYKPKNHQNRNNINLRHFIQKQCAVDILFDADNGILKICVVGMNDPLHEAKIYNIKKNKYLPHFLLGWESIKTKMKLIEINYNYYSKDISNLLNMFSGSDQLLLHFIGIYKQQKQKQLQLFNDINVDHKSLNTVSITTPLTTNSTIGRLKKFISKVYTINENRAILILYSNDIISNNDKLKLKGFGITNQSVLLIAIGSSINIVPGIQDIHSKKKKKLLNNIKPIKGFDIITREDNVYLYKMPNCGHLMSKQSLYQYAMIKYSNIENINLTCPHEKKQEKKQENDFYIPPNQWSCTFCTFLNPHHRTICTMCSNRRIIQHQPEISKFCDKIWDYLNIKKILLLNSNKYHFQCKLEKLELLSARNKIQKEYDLQKCPKCNTFYYKNKNMNKSSAIYEFKKKFKTKCIICCQSKIDIFFCWGCGKEWQSDHHFCDTAFLVDLVDILSKANKKQIGSVHNVPSVRCCPNCYQLITHIEACKHMKCTQCKIYFCFICLKPMVNGQWQCGSPSSICPISPIQTIDMLSRNVIVNKKILKLF